MCNKKGRESTEAARNVHEELKMEIGVRSLKVSLDEEGTEGKSETL